MDCQHISVILKVTERCNLACPYCYFFFGGDESHADHPPTLKRDLTERVIGLIRDAQDSTGINAVRIVLHGGEPLLLKKARLGALCRRLREAFDDLVIGIQTNAVLIDDEWIDLFADHGVRVGVSVDGPKSLHDTTRIDKQGRGSFDETRVAWDKLTAAAALGRIPFPGLLCVISPEHSGREIYEFLVRDFGARGISFLLPDLLHDAIALKFGHVERCTNFLLEVCDAWAADKDHRISVKFIDDFVGAILSDELMQRKRLDLDPLHQLCISSNGDVCPSDVIRGYDVSFSLTGCNVAHTRYDELSMHPAWAELADASKQLPSACRGCEWREYCRGGQLQHRFSRKARFDNPSVYCSTLQQVYGRLREIAVSAGVPAESIARRLAAAPDCSTVNGDIAHA